ncbi:hypothetical protein HYW76_05790 [Candidatus Pacearchaeota archaeon]|nr:hypothetical protein [Candidatus Pacearchaeota archaeon]
MKMQFIIFIAILLLIFLNFNVTYASSAMPDLAINNETMECALFYQGDDGCASIDILPGWESIRISIESYSDFGLGPELCPSGYKFLGEFDPIHGKDKTPFCCTCCHDGSWGDCNDTIVNLKEKKCAFLDNATNCDQLPDNWGYYNVQDNIRGCPSEDYEWINETIKCNKTNNPIQVIYFLSFIFIILVLILIIFLLSRFFNRRL